MLENALSRNAKDREETILDPFLHPDLNQNLFGSILG